MRRGNLQGPGAKCRAAANRLVKGAASVGGLFFSRSIPRPHPVLSVDPAALHAPLEVDRDTAAILYLKGISTSDFSEALAALLGKDAAGLSASAMAA